MVHVHIYQWQLTSSKSSKLPSWMRRILPSQIFLTNNKLFNFCLTTASVKNIRWAFFYEQKENIIILVFKKTFFFFKPARDKCVLLNTFIYGYIMTLWLLQISDHRHRQCPVSATWRCSVPWSLSPPPAPQPDETIWWPSGSSR